jgi:hypothetical protein
VSLQIDTSIKQLEVLLRDTITFALKQRLPAAATIAAMRAIPSTSNGQTARRDRDLVVCTANGLLYSWSRYSTAADDGNVTVMPSDVASGEPGRWVQASSPALLAGVPIVQLTSGLLKEVMIHNGDFSDQALKARIFGRAPCIAIHFSAASNELISPVPGALYEHDVAFELWSVARNFRDQDEASVGSPLAGDAPDVLDIHGSLKKLLADNATGEQLGETGIKQVNFGEERLEYADMNERVFVFSLAVEVKAAVHNPDAPSELVTPTEIDVQRYDANAQQTPTGPIFDQTNMVTSGLTVPLGIGFAKTIEAGTAVVGGAPLTVGSSAQTFEASSDTYRDLSPTGTWALTVVPNNQTPSDPPTGYLRVGVTVTDSAGVAFDRITCSLYQPDGDPDQVDLA